METPPTKQRLILSTGKVDGRASGGGDAFSTDFCNLVFVFAADTLRCKSKIFTSSSFRRPLESFTELDIVVGLRGNVL